MKKVGKNNSAISVFSRESETETMSFMLEKDADTKGVDISNFHRSDLF